MDNSCARTGHDLTQVVQYLTHGPCSGRAHLHGPCNAATPPYRLILHDPLHGFCNSDEDHAKHDGYLFLGHMFPTPQYKQNVTLKGVGPCAMSFVLRYCSPMRAARARWLARSWLAYGPGLAAISWTCLVQGIRCARPLAHAPNSWIELRISDLFSDSGNISDSNNISVFGNPMGSTVRVEN